MPSEHARLSPSSAHRWIPCGAALAEAEHNPREESSKGNKYQDEGTAAHELAERTLAEGHRDTLELEGDMAENGIMFTEEMCKFVQLYVKGVRDFADGHELYVEERVDFSAAIGVPDSFGTSDAIVVTADGKELQLHDLKYGLGVQVFATNNEQLMLYALGALRKFDMLGDIETVRLVIHQPRLNHVDEWMLSVADLREFGKKAKAAAAKAIKLADGGTPDQLLAAMVPGPKQCKFCPVKATCPARLGEAASAMQVDLSDLLNGGKEVIEKAIAHTAQLTNAELGALMPKLDSIGDWLKAIRAAVETKLLAGEEVPGFKLVEGKKGARAWTNEEAVEELLVKKFRLKTEEAYKMSLQSPTAIEKLLKSSPLRWNQLADLIAQSEGKPSVAPLSDKRPALRLDVDLSALIGGEDENPET